MAPGEQRDDHAAHGLGHTDHHGIQGIFEREGALPPVREQVVGGHGGKERVAPGDKGLLGSIQPKSPCAMCHVPCAPGYERLRLCKTARWLRLLPGVRLASLPARAHAIAGIRSAFIDERRGGTAGGASGGRRLQFTSNLKFPVARALAKRLALRSSIDWTACWFLFNSAGSCLGSYLLPASLAGSPGLGSQQSPAALQLVPS